MAESTAPLAEDEPEQLIGGLSGRLLGLVALGSMASIVGRLVIAPMLPQIIADLGISPARAGLALSIMAGLTGVCRYPGGRLADRWSRKTVLVGALGLMIAGMVALAGAVTYGLFVLGTALAGIGAGLYFPAGIALLTDVFDDRRGEAFGVNTAAFSLGGALASGLAVAVLAVAGWRSAFLLVIAALTVTTVFMHIWNDEEYVVKRVGLAIRPTMGRLLGIAAIRRALVAYVLFAFVWQGTVNFLPTFLQVEKGFSGSLASAAFASLFVVGTITNPLAGSLGDRIGYSTVGVGSAVAGSIGLTLVLLGGSLPLVIGGVLIFATGLASFWPVMSAHVMDLFPESSMGGDFGAIGSIYLGVGSLGPTYVGVVAEAHSYTVAFVGLSACLVISTFVMIWIVSGPSE
ncbi:MAG: MFS transporter [Halobacteriales archaeon]